MCSHHDMLQVAIAKDKTHTMQALGKKIFLLVKKLLLSGMIFTP